jgi:putative transposase
MKPAAVHFGLATALREERARVLAAAYQAHPERFVRGSSSVHHPPKKVCTSPAGPLWQNSHSPPG